MTLPRPRNQRPSVANAIFIGLLVLAILAMSLALNILWVRFIARF